MKSFWALSALVASSFLISGCSSLTSLFSSEDNSPDPTPLVEFSPTVSLHQIWREKVGSGNDDLYVLLRPAYAHGRLFVVDVEGHVLALNKDTGEELWENDTEKSATGGVGILDNRLVLIGTADGDVIALDQATGKEQWRTQLESEVLAAPNGAGNHVIAYAGNNVIYGLDANTGAIDWKVNSDMPALILRGNSPPLLVNEQFVYIGLNNGRVLALNTAEGSRLWESTVSLSRGRSEIQRMVDIVGPMAVEGNTLYVVSYQGNAAALALSTGAERWKREMSSYSGLSVNKKYLAITDADDVVWLLFANDGKTVWKQEDLMYRGVTQPVFWEDYVIVADKEGYLHMLSLEKGTFVGRIEVGGEGISASPFVLSRKGKEALYVLTNNGHLHVYTRAK